MTPEQREQWNLYSCVPRCIIRLAELRGAPITDVEFAERFASRNPEWNNRFGLTSIHNAIQIAFELQLATAWAHIKDVADFRSMVTRGEPLDHALVVTHKMRSPETGNLVELHHCRLFLGFENGGPNLIVHNPNQDGSSFEMRESFESLMDQDAEFFLFRRS